MSLVKTSKVDDADEMLDIAFRRARERRDASHATIKGRKDISRMKKSQRAETQRIAGAGKSLRHQLESVRDAFPSFNQLAPFYQALVSTVCDMDELRNNLGKVGWAAERVEMLTRNAMRQTAECTDLEKINAIRRAHYGRCASVVKQIDNALNALDQVRKVLKDLPTIKTSIFTAIIAGMPNVGKSTLLSALSGAKPEIQPYAFTTKHLMLGYTTLDGQKVQLIDTPGLLERPPAERNDIEKRAALAMQHLANAIVFLIDPTLNAGYSLDEQLRLLKDLRKEFSVPFIIVVNKADIATASEKKGVPGQLHAISISAQNGDDITTLRDALAALLPVKSQE